MTPTEILRHRLINHGILQTQFENSAEVVSWLGAVQSQDFYGGKWALGLRLKNSKDAGIEKAFNEGAILRTHVLRPTWHFVVPEDIRWMLQLTGKRVIAAMASQHRQLELDNATIKRCNATLRKALKGDKYLMRDEIAVALKKAGVVTDGQRFIHLMMRAELDEVVCSGPRLGKQLTYSLLDERAPKVKSFYRDEAIGELSLRYFTSHGPATLKDFAWWSGLTVADAREGVEMNKSKLTHEVIDGKTYWFADSVPLKKKSSSTAYLLPNYDEYVIAYGDRNNLFKEEYSKKTPRGNVIFNNSILVDGKVVGIWQRTFRKNNVIIEKKFVVPTSKSQRQLVDKAEKRYRKFIIPA